MSASGSHSLQSGQAASGPEPFDDRQVGGKLTVCFGAAPWTTGHSFYGPLGRERIVCFGIDGRGQRTFAGLGRPEVIALTGTSQPALTPDTIASRAGLSRSKALERNGTGSRPIVVIPTEERIATTAERSHSSGKIKVSCGLDPRQHNKCACIRRSG